MPCTLYVSVSYQLQQYGKFKRNWGIKRNCEFFKDTQCVSVNVCIGSIIVWVHRYKSKHHSTRLTTYNGHPLQSAMNDPYWFNFIVIPCHLLHWLLQNLISNSNKYWHLNKIIVDGSFLYLCIYWSLLLSISITSRTLFLCVVDWEKDHINIVINSCSKVCSKTCIN